MICILSIDPGGGSGSATLFKGFEPVKVMSFPHTVNWDLELYWWCLVDKPDQCLIEMVQGWAGQGGKSQFNFGESTGAAITAVKIGGVPIERPQPTWWQRRCGLPHRNEIPDRSKRRLQMKLDQRAFCLSRWPWLEQWDQRIGKSKPDVWASVCQGYAGALEAAGVPLGQLA